MNLHLSEDQVALRDTLRRFIVDRGLSVPQPPEENRDCADHADLWTEMAVDLGLAGIAIPEQLGGAGYSFQEVAVVLEETGRALVGTPYFGTVVLATTALLHAGDPSAAQEHLPAIAAGDRTATVALTGPAGRLAPDSVTVDAVETSAGWVLSGSACYVVDGVTADLLLVLARVGAGEPTLFSLPGADAGVTRAEMTSLDLTRPLARIDFERAPARLVGKVGGGWRVAEIVRDHALAGLGAEQVGAARACLAMSVEYARTRIQFGRPIGSFQAIKHRCAETLLEIEAADSAARGAAWAAAEQPESLPTAAALAASVCAEAAILAAEENIQIHGGIGFTWEHPAHLYFRRAVASSQLFGSPDDARERLLTLAGV